MANVVLIGLEKSTANQLSRTLAADRHHVKIADSIPDTDDIVNVDIIFHDGAERRYLPVLTELRKVRPSLPFVVVSGEKDTAEWLDALEAGATDYCAAPLDPRYVSWLMELAVPTPPRIAAA